MTICPTCGIEAVDADGTCTYCLSTRPPVAAPPGDTANVEEAPSTAPQRPLKAKGKGK